MLVPESASARLFLQCADVLVVYLFDDASLRLVHENPDWKQDADARIEKIRKQNVTVKYELYTYR